ncbi:MAG: SoxR reducing system RseC family protein [Deltaproteobacteria bacterium]|nr:SoxR reducing system RseC family protein [Deltaproteobacteria bacterium]MBN2671429.1 SoxR reducing system RseC family protein [Deltaproteobacteria bacterium]
MTSVCHETATVTQVLPQNKVQVVVQRNEACGSCSAKGACQSLGGQTKDFFLVLENRLGASVGQKVRITLSDAAVIQASAILYLLPALLLIGVALAGSLLAPSLQLTSDTGAMLGAVVGLGLGFTASYFLAKRAEKNRQNIPAITEIMADEI